MIGWYWGVIVIAVLGLSRWYLTSGKKKEKIKDESLSSEEGCYGKPDEIIITNPTRANEPDGAIEVYEQEKFLVINGIRINKKDIVDIRLINEGVTPYFENDYQIRISTILDDKPNLYVSVGNDLSWAQEVCEQIIALSLPMNDD